jgi:hypothetical protein
MTGHWSDCAIYNAPALPTGPCDCGGLELALDSAHDLIPALIAGARPKGPLFCNGGSGRLIQAQQLPAEGLITDTAASDLPNTHNGVVLLSDANGVNLNVADRGRARLPSHSLFGRSSSRHSPSTTACRTQDQPIKARFQLKWTRAAFNPEQRLRLG